MCPVPDNIILVVLPRAVSYIVITEIPTYEVEAKED